MKHKLHFKKESDIEMGWLLLDNISIAYGNFSDHNFEDMIKAIQKSFDILGIELEFVEEERSL